MDLPHPRTTTFGNIRTEIKQGRFIGDVCAAILQCELILYSCSHQDASHGGIVPEIGFTGKYQTGEEVENVCVILLRRQQISQYGKSGTYLDPVDRLRHNDARAGEMPQTQFCIFDRDSECEPTTRIVPQNVRAIEDQFCRILHNANH